MKDTEGPNLKEKTKKLKEAETRLRENQKALIAIEEKIAQKRTELRDATIDFYVKKVATNQQRLTLRENLAKAQEKLAVAEQDVTPKQEQLQRVKEAEQRLQQEQTQRQTDLRSLAERIQAKQIEIEGLQRSPNYQDLQTRVKQTLAEQSSIRDSLQNAEAQLQALQESIDKNRQRVQEKRSQLETHVNNLGLEEATLKQKIEDRNQSFEELQNLPRTQRSPSDGVNKKSRRRYNPKANRRPKIRAVETGSAERRALGRNSNRDTKN